MSGAASSNIAVKIGFDDQALDRIPAANKKIQSLETSAGRAAKGIQTMVQGGGTEKLSKGMRGLARESLAAFENIGRIMGPLEVITGAASVAGLARMASEWGNLTTQLGYSAQRAGLGVNQLSALQGAATLVGVSAQSLTAGMTALNDNLTNAATGRAPEAIAAFNYLHIALRGANGQLRSSVSVLPEIADGLAAVKDPAIQAQLATALLGGAAADLLPFLRQGSAGIAQLTQEARSYGTTTDADLKISNRFTHQQGELIDAIGGLSNVIGEKYLPALGDAEQALASFIKANKDAISDGIGALTAAMGAFAAYTSGKFLTKIAKALLGDLPKIIDGMGIPGLVGLAAAMTLDPNTSIQKGSDEEAALKEAIERINVIRQAEGLPALPMPQAQPANLSQQVYEQNQQNGPRGSAAGSGAHPSSPIAETSLPSAAKSFLNTLASGESGGDYSRSYGTLPDFKGFAQHPDIESTGPDGRPTSAAGRYQFEYGTWQEVAKALGLQNFSPASQDQAAWYLAQQTYAAKTGRDLLTDLQAHNPKIDAGIKAALASTWPSITGDNLEPPPRKVPQLSLPSRAEAPKPSPVMAGIQQHQHSDDDHADRYRSGITGALVPFDGAPSGAPLNIGSGTGAPPASANETTVKGAVAVTVNLKGAPPGTQTSATSDGDAFASSGPVKVQTSSVGQGTHP